MDMEKKNMPLTAEERQAWFERYNTGIHREGRLWLLVNLIVLLAVPFAMGMVLHAMPDMNRFLRGFSTWRSSIIPPASSST